jgi:hypothetical protein
MIGFAGLIYALINPLERSAPNSVDIVTAGYNDLTGADDTSTTTAAETAPATDTTSTEGEPATDTTTTEGEPATEAETTGTDDTSTTKGALVKNKKAKKSKSKTNVDKLNRD